ncbi:MAG: GntR family transcriptional regulator [Clostridia bacterium]|jgi:GntR family transcriptional repressor for pyruvate dehydrogenase complex|nr:GntR family transcriptional regulator [Clostridia bacterium]
MKAIQRTPVVQLVVDNIKAYILSGEISKGDKLPTEKDLCEKLSISRSTLREAIRILQAHGFVELKPGKGAFVARTRELDLEDVIEWFISHEVELIDFIEVRQAIEPLAIRLAIQRVTPKDLAILQHINDQFVKSIMKDDVPNIILLDELFHNTIVEVSRNKLLISINNKISECFKEFRSKTFRVPANARNAITPHSKIMEAIEQHDVEAGEKYMKEHLNSVIADLNKITNG